MKYNALIFLLICTTSKASTTYYIESVANENMLSVRLDRGGMRAATKLILRGKALGIENQVRHLTCDGQLIEEGEPGIWSIPVDCAILKWQIPVLKNENAIAASQQSMKSQEVILISEASSLPRLQDASNESIVVDEITNTIPQKDNNGLIPLPDTSSAPFFILLNATKFQYEPQDSISLTYLLDDPNAVSTLPSMCDHMRALGWLNTVIPTKKKESFNVTWLGISKNHMALSGATGTNMLLVNYPKEGELTYGKAMLLYVAMHEAFHQLAMNYPNQPTWVSESLAAYYGARAVKIALPHDSNSDILMARFEKDGAYFSNGLLAINKNILNGDHSEYSAFYTKGLVFWMTVDKIMQEKEGNSLDNYLTQLFQIEYDEYGVPLNMREILNVSKKDWEHLRKQFLD